MGSWFQRQAPSAQGAAPVLVTLFILMASALLDAEDPLTVLERAAARYRDGAARVADFTQSYLPAGFAIEKKETGTVIVQAPENLRFDYSSPEKKTFTYDGVEARFYSPADHQLIVRTLTAEEKARLPIVFLTDPTGLWRSFEISLQVQNDVATVLLIPRSKESAVTALRLTFSAPDAALQKISYDSPAGDRNTFRFGPFRRERARPAWDFRIMAPSGTRVEAQ